MAAGAAVLTGLSALAKPAIKKYHIGVQLFSVREDMKKDPLDTLAKVAAMGYREVEPANYVDRKIYGYSAAEFKKILDDLGLSMPTSHTGFKKTHWDITKNDITDSYKNTIEDAVVTGQKIMIVPSFDWDKKNIDDVKKGIEAFNRLGEIASKSGLRIGFHNHHQEFEEKYGDECLYDFMLREWDSNYVCQQLDIENMSVAGVDPMVFLRKYPKHYESIHVKDFDPKTKLSTHLGEGSLKMDEILSFARRNTPIQYWVIEQEDYGTKTPLEAIDFDLHRFKKYGFI